MKVRLRYCSNPDAYYAPFKWIINDGRWLTTIVGPYDTIEEAYVALGERIVDEFSKTSPKHFDLRGHRYYQVIEFIGAAGGNRTRDIQLGKLCNVQ